MPTTLVAVQPFIFERTNHVAKLKAALVTEMLVSRRLREVCSGKKTVLLFPGKVFGALFSVSLIEKALDWIRVDDTMPIDQDPEDQVGLERAWQKVARRLSECEEGVVILVDPFRNTTLLRRYCLEELGIKRSIKLDEGQMIEISNGDVIAFDGRNGLD